MMELLEKIAKDNLPRNVAIIMDGNGRWAKAKGMERIFGHQNAVDALTSSVEVCLELKIPVLTLYCFSTENWNRPKLEVNALMTLLSNVCKKEENRLMSYNIQVSALGDVTALPPKTRASLETLIATASQNTGLKLVLCINYGSRTEMVDAVQSIAQKVKKGDLQVDQIDEALIEQSLYTHDLPPLDLMIRTSGEQRISNFMLWQLAYTELYFTDVLWPNFRKEDFYKALLFYQGRERRFGKTGQQP